MSISVNDIAPLEDFLGSGIFKKHWWILAIKASAQRNFLMGMVMG
jgi:hypothetical protein